MKLITLTTPTADKSSELELFIGRYQNKNTQATYLHAVGVFTHWLKFNTITSIDSVDFRVLESFKHDIELDYSPKSASMIMGVIKEFFNYLETRGVISVNEAKLVKCTQVSSREQKTEVLTEAEVNLLLKSIYSLPNDVQSNSSKIMFLLLVNAGLRVTELANLKMSDLKLQSGHYILTVHGKNRRFRYIPLSAAVTTELLNIFNSYPVEADGYLIKGHDLAGNADHSKPMVRSCLEKRVKKLGLKAGIEKDITPHSLRRTCATLMYKRNVPIEGIQRILGHENVGTTHRYLDMTIDIEVGLKHVLSMTNNEEAV